MDERCQARLMVPAPFGGGHGQLSCCLPMGHRDALHLDIGLKVYWTPFIPGSPPC